MSVAWVALMLPLLPALSVMLRLPTGARRARAGNGRSAAKNGRAIEGVSVTAHPQSKILKNPRLTVTPPFSTTLACGGYVGG